MGTKKIQSNSVLVIDATDTRNLTLHLSANKPTTQIYNKNTSAYTPGWTTSDKLIVSPTLYIGSKLLTSADVTFLWQRKNGIDSSLENLSTTLKNGHQIVGGSLQISTNALSTNPIITYICTAQYDGLSASAEIVFCRSDVGLNGADGTSITIKGTAESVTAVTSSNFFTIKYASGTVAAAQLGDAYLYNGDLYVCSQLNANGGTQDYFINVGKIQGPSGENGKSLSLSASSQIFKTDSNGIISPAAITISSNVTNTSISSWTYSTNGGQSYSSELPQGVSQSGSRVSIIGANMQTDSIIIKASDGTCSDTVTIYKVINGTNGEKGEDGESAPVVFLTNENITFDADSKGRISATTTTCNVIAYVGASPVLPTIGTINTPEGMSITQTSVGQEIRLTITIANNATLGSNSSNSGSITIPVTASNITTNLRLGWSKINTGRSISAVITKYAVSTNNVTPPTTWSTTRPVKLDGEYLWVVDYIEYDDDTNDTIGARVVTGDSGKDGIDASLIKLTPSAQFFKSNKGQSGEYFPSNITITPSIQNDSFSKWEYSINGGTTWNQITSTSSASNNVFYNASDYTLTVPAIFIEFTNTVTAISFRCITVNGYSDVVTLSKIFDVSGLEMGGRNLAGSTNHGTYNWNWIMQTGGAVKTSYDENNDNLVKCCKMTRDSVAQTGYSVIYYSDIGRRYFEPATDYAISFKVKPSVTTSFTCALREPNGNNLMSAEVTNVANMAIANSWNELRYIIHTVDSLPASMSQVLYMLGFNSNIGVEYIFKDLKIERGNTFSDWTPSPDDITTRFESAESEITKNKNAIDLKVSKGSVISEINQSAEQIKISADKIKLEGIITANNNFVIDNSGQVTVKGNIRAQTMDVNDDLYMIEAGSGDSGIVWGTESQKYTKGNPYIYGNCSSKKITLGVSDTYLLMDAKGTQISWGDVTGNTNNKSYLIVDQNSVAVGYKTNWVQMNNSGITINGYGLRDFVIEQGTSGNWKYRKWNSGISECWGEFAYTNDTTSAWGYVYETGRHQEYFPSGLFVTRPGISMSGWGDNGAVLSVEQAGAGSKDITHVFYFTRASSQSNHQVRVEITAKGWWK